ncbi:MAG: MFS transporter [Candidatus Dadabacteria bacterium]|nr:MFS transporter [Candidatus Dadabacteria bacterium]
MASLNRTELQAVLVISFIIALRLLGIFLLLPVFSTYAIRYPGASLALVGVAFGVYPLVQSLLQIPFGWASDRLGRKNLIIIGLVLFSVGSVLGGLSSSIGQLIAARALQGGGAIGAVAIAALGDLTRPEVRAQAFTIVGMTIGAAFVIGLIGGPVLAAHFGFGSLFYILAALGVVALLVAIVCVPTAKVSSPAKTEVGVRDFITHESVRRIHVAVLICSFSINLFFFLYPLNWTQFGLEQANLWKVYIVVLLPSLVLVFPYIRQAEKADRLGSAPLIGYLAMTAGFLVYLIGGVNKVPLYVTGALFFLGYTIYQAILPAFLTQRIPKERRGTALGFYNFASFLGASLGGMLAGFLYHFGYRVPLAVGLALLIAWLFIGLPRSQPRSNIEGIE